MQHLHAIATALLLTLGVCSGVKRDETHDTPVTKVVELLQEMQQKGSEEMHAEQAQYAAFDKFCVDTKEDKTDAIAKAAQEIEMLNAEIEQAISHEAQLSSEIAGHQADVAGWEAQGANASGMRAEEKVDYEALHIDYAESIDAIERAIQTLKAQDYARAQASFAQLKKSKLIPDDARRALELFLSQSSEEVGAPEASAYEFQSGSIIEVLQGLLEKFEAELDETVKHEVNSKHSHTLLIQDLDMQIANGKKDVETKSDLKAKTLQAKAEAQGTLAETTATKAEDEHYLSDLTGTCAQKATDYEARQKLRTEELAAIQKALDILTSPAVAGAAATYLPSLAQVKRTALGMLRSNLIGAESLRKTKEFLQQQSQKQHSKLLSAVARQVAEDDPFVKVKKMIQDLVVKLMEESNQEAGHKGWCDKELATNDFTRTEKTEAVDGLHSEIASLDSSIAKLTEDIADLSKSVADLSVAMRDATELRAEEKAANAKTGQDAKDGQTAVANAIVVLREFYGKAADATALMQQQPVAPEIFESPYTGMQGESEGVIGVLEVVASDFARLEADTESEEAAAQKEFQDFMGDSNLDSTVNSRDIEHKTNTKQEQEQALALAHAELEDTQKELDAALSYYDKLKPACVDVGGTATEDEMYQERKTTREAEIQSLKEALEILSQDSV